ncbi:MAG: SLC13 family permease [Acidobacteriaceae bacterium]
MHVAAWVIFLVSYGVFAFGRLPGTKVDRPAMAVIGAALMFGFRVLTPRFAIDSIDYTTIVLLFAMMLIVGGLHLGGFFQAVTGAIVGHLNPRYLLPGLIFTAGILSAFLVNDVVCLFMAPLVLKLVDGWELPAVPYLLALATASNIGSVATITGNPQNILIGSVSQIGYMDFLAHLGPIAVMGLVVDWAVLHWFFVRGRQMPDTRSQTPDARRRTPEVRRQTPDAGLRTSDAGRQTPDAGGEQPLRVIPVLVMLAVLGAFFAGVAPALAAALGAAALLLLLREEPRKLFAEVDWGLLILFLGLFLVLGGAQQAGISRQLLDRAARLNLHQTAVYAVFTVALSNVVSNVPAVMLLKGTIAGFKDQHSAWLLLAMASTLAGNLTITGSVANLIVVEKAAPEAHVGFLAYARVGVPITVITVAMGWAWLQFVKY